MKKFLTTSAITVGISCLFMLAIEYPSVSIPTIVFAGIFLLVWENQ